MVFLLLFDPSLDACTLLFGPFLSWSLYMWLFPPYLMDVFQVCWISWSFILCLLHPRLDLIFFLLL